MEPNKRRKKSATKQTVETMTSLGGYMIGSILIGMFVDENFFNKSGISVVVAALIGILLVVASIVRLVIINRDN